MNDIDYNKELFTLEEMLGSDIEEEKENNKLTNISKEIRNHLDKKQGSKLIYVLEEMDYNDAELPFNELKGIDRVVGDRLISISKELNLSLFMATLVIKENRFLEALPNEIDFQKDLKEWDNYDFDTFLINFVDLNNNEWSDMVMTTLEFDELLPGGSLSELEPYKKKLPFNYQSQITQSFFYKVSTFVLFKQSETESIIDKFCSNHIIKERELNKLKSI